MVDYSDNLSVKKFIENLGELKKYLDESLAHDESLKNNLIREIDNIKNIFVYPPIEINGLVSMCLDFDFISKMLLHYTNLNSEEQVQVIMSLVIRNIEAGILEDEYFMLKSDFVGNIIVDDKLGKVENNDRLMHVINKYRSGDTLDAEEEEFMESIVVDRDNNLANSIKVIEDKYFENLLGYGEKDIESIISAFRNLGTDTELCYKIKNVLTRDMISRETINKFLRCVEKGKIVIDNELKLLNENITNKKMSYQNKELYFNKIKQLNEIKGCFDYCGKLYRGFSSRICISFYEIQKLLMEKAPLTDDEKAILIIELVKRNVEAGIFTKIQISKDDPYNNIRTDKNNQRLLMVNNLGYINLDYFVANTRVIYDKYLNNMDSYTEDDIEQVVLSFKNIGIEKEFCDMISKKLKRDFFKRNKDYNKMQKDNANTLIFKKGQDNNIKGQNNNIIRTTITESEYMEIRKELKKYIDLYDMQIIDLSAFDEKHYIGELLLKINVEESRIRKFFMNADKLFKEKMGLIEFYKRNYDKYEYYIGKGFDCERLDEINSLIALFESDEKKSEIEVVKSLLAVTNDEEDKKYLESEIEKIHKKYERLKENIDRKIKTLEGSWPMDYEYEFMKIKECQDTDKLLSKMRKN